MTAGWLITISFIIDNYWSGGSSVESVQKIVSKNIHRQQEDLEQLMKDTVLVKRLATRNYDEKTLLEISEEPPYFFIDHINLFNDQENVFWSTQKIRPPANLSILAEGIHFLQLSNGWYVVKIKMLQVDSANKLRLTGLIPVKWNYYTENIYLQNSFVAIRDINNRYDISKTEGEAIVKEKDGKPLFFLKKRSEESVASNNRLGVWLRIIAALLVLLYVHICAVWFVMKKGVIRGSLFLVGTILFLRVLSYFLPIPFHLRQLELFDPAIYGSNIILRTLGDLFINSLLFAWIILFIRFYLHGRMMSSRVLATKQKYFRLGIISLVMVATTLMLGHVIRSLVTDSQISFDVVDFFSLNVYSVIGFVVLCSLAAGYFFLFQVLVFLVGPSVKGQTWQLYLSLAILGLLTITLWPGNDHVTFELLLLSWMVFFIWLLNYNYLTILASKLISSKFIFWIFFFSVSITAVIVSKNKDKDFAKRKHLAESIATREDPAAGMLMNIMLLDFGQNFLSENFQRFHDVAQNKFLKDSIVNQNYSAYLNRYDTRIYTFDAEGKPLFNVDETPFNTLAAIVETQGKPTDVPGLFYYDLSYDKFAYISKKEARDRNNILLGYAFILSNPKKVKTDAVYPKLFVRGTSSSIENSPLYAFAVYTKNKLTRSHNDYPFPTELPKKNLTNNEFSAESVSGYDVLWYKAGGDKVIVVAKQDRFFIESITLFAYIFCSFLLLTAVFFILNLLIRGRFNLQRVSQLWHLSIRNQVHGTIIFISVLSFVVIGVATILFFISRYHNNNREKLSRTIKVMETQVRKSMQDFSVFDDEMKIYDVATQAKLDKLINDVSDIHDVDINLYDLAGDLKVSSFNFPYEKGLVSTKMDPLAFYHISHLKEVQYFKEQQIGSLSYLSNYVPVRDASGKEYAYLNIPYFQSQDNLNEEISNFLVTIINLNAFIFLIAGIVALFITNRITQSFSLISNKMKEVNLGQVNEEIVWNRKDEIGELVHEYNKMVKKLDTSAEMLARSEREGAWREMARQVAHEIKNPLTPMKLNLQYLQMAIDTNAPGVKEISVNVARTLLDQIEHLSRIASDFSQFANIGQRKNELFNVVEMLEQIVTLFSGGDHRGITLKSSDEEIIILADRTQVNRLFTNLIKNAVQAIPPDRDPEIDITVTKEDEMVLVGVHDNGVGIPASMKARIFTPNFTTKTSGTGLGLAMCKGIVEQAHGNIWFETREGKGTIFYVELPIANDVTASGE